MRKIAIAALAALFTMSSVALADGPRRGGGMKQQQQALSGSFVDSRDQSSHRVDGDDFPVAQAWAAPLAASNDTCMGSSSAGGQAASFGVSIATTWRDGDCVRRKDARLLHNMGLSGVAAALMCQKDNVAAAFEAAGVACVNPAIEQPAEAETKAIVAPVVTDELGEVEQSSFNAWDGVGHGFVH